MNLGTKLLVFFNLILLFIGFAGIIAGAAGDSWWEGGVTTRSYKESLLRLCDGQTECKQREDILGFKENQRGLLYLLFPGGVLGLENVGYVRTGPPKLDP